MIGMEKNEVNIIVPVHNTPVADLKRAFNSIVSQEYEKWKAIIVDDGSNAECAKWIDEYAKNNEKFIVYHLSNQGVSNARNFGLLRSTGEYTIFLDSDDELENGIMRNGIKLMQNYNLDVVCGGTKRIYSDKEVQYVCSANGGIPRIYKGREKIKLFAYMLTGQSSRENTECNTILLARVFSKIYKTDVIKKILFDTSVCMGEDNLFSFDVLLNSESFAIVDDVWYKYYDNEYSVTNPRKAITDSNIDYQYIFLKKIEKYKEICKEYELLDEFNLRKVRILKNYVSDIIHYEGSANHKIRMLAKEKIGQIAQREYLQKKSDKIFDFIFGYSSEKVRYLLLCLIVFLLKRIRKIRIFLRVNEN